jgi:hypothetical protein
MSDRSAQSIAGEADATDAPSGKRLKRADVARILGMSVSSLRRREGSMLTPIVGEDGVHLFDEAEVRAVMITMRGKSALAAMGPSSGDIASEVFTLLDERVHPVEIVKRLRLTPDVAIALHKQWADMRGGFTVSCDQALELGRIVRAAPPSTAIGAIASLRRRVDMLTRMRQGSTRCDACYDATASMCEACVVSTRGPLSTVDVRVEQRMSEDGYEELRVIAEVYWDDVDETGGTVASLWSDWHPFTDLANSPIADIATGLHWKVPA